MNGWCDVDLGNLKELVMGDNSSSKMAYHAHFFFQQFHARITGPSTEKNFIKLNTIPTTENKDKNCALFSATILQSKKCAGHFSDF